MDPSFIRRLKGGIARTQFIALAATTSTLVVPYNKDRLSLILSSASSTAITYGWGGNLGQLQGILFPNASNPMVFSLLQHGAIVIGPVFAIASLAVTIGYVEVIQTDI